MILNFATELKRIGTVGFLLLLFALKIFGQQPIEQIRSLPLGSVVTTTGTITSGPEFGQIRYMQNAIAGIALYSSSLSSTFHGDSILVTGVLSKYRGELQLSPVISFQVIEQGRMTAAKVVSGFSDLSDSLNESTRVAFGCLGISSCESHLDEGWYIIYDPLGNQSRLFVAQGSSIIGFPLSDKPVSVNGIWTKFENQYQFICQQITDSSEGNCHIIPAGEVSFNGSETRLSWENLMQKETWLEYGNNDFDQTIALGNIGGDIDVPVQLQSSGLIFKGRLGQLRDNLDTVYAPAKLFTGSVAHPFPIEILFNRQVNTAFSDGSHPKAIGSSVIESDLIQRIDQVVATLDIAMYNTTRAPIVQAVSRAVQRGVTVRYIADDETSNSALSGTLTFPVYYRSGSGIMHNKFIIADAEDPDKVWLWAGSTNLSTNQLSSDPNHAYVIHDLALALNYRREFDEMWGQPANQINSSTGDIKTDNTVHQFKIGETLIESYFSPSDETNCHILHALQSTDHHIQIGLLLLTKEDLVDEIIHMHQMGIDVRVIVEDESSSSSALARLQQENVPVAIHDLSSIFHHKYAIIDEGFPESAPQVITGSHNWTWSADNINDENTLIIHDQSVTNIFRQEFEARWSELNTTSTYAFSNNHPILYPNPASGHITITNPISTTCTLSISDVHGRVLAVSSMEAYQSLNMDLDPNLSSGMYLIHWKWSDQYYSTRFMILR